MAETASALCFSTFSSSIPFSKDPISSPSTSFPPRRLSSQFHRRRSRSLRFTVRSSGSAHFLGDDAYGFYPWENPDAAESCIFATSPCVYSLRWLDLKYLCINFELCKIIVELGMTLLELGLTKTLRRSSILIFFNLYFSFSCFVVAIQWISEEKVTLFTSDGLIQIGGNLIPRRVSSSSSDVCLSSFFLVNLILMGIW